MVYKRPFPVRHVKSHNLGTYIKRARRLQSCRRSFNRVTGRNSKVVSMTSTGNVQAQPVQNIECATGRSGGWLECQK